MRKTTLFLITLVLLAACSSSSDSSRLPEDNSVVSEIDSNINTAVEEMNDGANDNADSFIDGVVVQEAQDSENIVVETIPNELDSDSTTQTVPDPMIQNKTQVDFDITVPAYQSGALQVRLTWGDVQATAGWVGDELWSLSLNFPSDTEHLLTIIFSDGNGNIELGTYEQFYRTGFNDAESLIISAEQFATDQWDTDNDGTSNIDELIDGSDPLINEDSLLEIRDSTDVALSFIVDNFESRITEERPYSEYYEEELVYHEGDRPPSGASHVIDINIDENGDGTVSDSRLEGLGIWPVRTTQTGTRTHTENTIQWEGQLQKSQDLADLYVTTNSVNIVSVIDEKTRKYEETYSYRYDTSDEDQYVTEKQVELIGEVIEGTSFCQPVSGSVERKTTRPFDRTGWSSRSSMSKAHDDQYWRVKSTVTGDEPRETEYFVREINSTFQCDFVDF